MELPIKCAAMMVGRMLEGTTTSGLCHSERRGYCSCCTFYRTPCKHGKEIDIGPPWGGAGKGLDGRVRPWMCSHVVGERALAPCLDAELRGGLVEQRWGEGLMVQ